MVNNHLKMIKNYLSYVSRIWHPVYIFPPLFGVDRLIRIACPAGGEINRRGFVAGGGRCGESTEPVQTRSANPE